MERVITQLGWPNAAELASGQEMVARLQGRCDLVLHGHRHRPAEVEAGTLRVIVCDAYLVTVAGENVPAAPAGRPETESEMDCVLPFTAVVATVYAALVPATTDRLVGDTAIVKSGDPLIVSVTLVECVALAPVAVTVSG